MASLFSPEAQQALAALCFIVIMVVLLSALALIITIINVVLFVLRKLNIFRGSGLSKKIMVGGAGVAMAISGIVGALVILVLASAVMEGSEGVLQVALLLLGFVVMFFINLAIRRDVLSESKIGHSNRRRGRRR
ncbi:MAG: hypothetical protein D6769_01090 [Methanobacteriota archaeon]|nr:MAG: hypothetical protein D6769_01090 [Euryarchaeota archaeon]